MNFYPFHIGDYLSHTYHLNDDEDLAYRRMIDLYYLSEKPFSQEPEWIAKRCKTTIEIVHYILSEFFELDSENNCWRNKRADEEISKYHAMQEGGRKGAALRWSKGSDTPPIDTPMLTMNQEPLTKNHKPYIKITTPEGVSESIFKEYLAMRKKAKKGWTERIQNKLTTEGIKLGWSLEKVLEHCLEKEWIGFEAAWVKKDEEKAKELPLGTDQQIEYAFKTECGGDPTKARFNSYYDMKKFILDHRDKRKAMQ